MWPLCFWLPITYMAAAPPVAAVFAIMTKVGVYAVLRVASLAFGAGAAHSAGLGAELLVAGGMATIAFGMFGVLASQGLGRLAGCSVLVSSRHAARRDRHGAASAAARAMLAGALYYMVSSTLAISALFLMIELIEREQGGVAAMLAVTAEAYGFGDEELDADGARPPELARARHDDRPRPLLRRLRAAARRAAAALGLRRQVRLALGHAEPGRARRGRPAGHAARRSAFTALVILSGPRRADRAAARRHPDLLGARRRRSVPKVLLIEIAPVIALLAVTVAITVEARPVMRYMEATAARPAPAAGLRRGRPGRAARARGATPRRRREPGMSRLVPYPLLTAALILMWLLLNRFSAGPPRPRDRGGASSPASRCRRCSRRSRASAAGTSIPRLARDRAPRHRPLEHRRRAAHPHRRPARAAALRLRRDPARRCATRPALAILAVIVTATPGTAWMEYDARREHGAAARLRPRRRGRAGST